MSDNVAQLPTALHAGDKAVPGMTSVDRFLNREVSWLAFNWRVLEEAGNANHPLLERLRFLSISSTNLNEFFMVRVAGLKGQVTAGVATPSQDGMTPAQQLAAIRREAKRLIEAQQLRWRDVGAALREAGIAVVCADELDTSERDWLGTWFQEQIYPVLTPFAVDATHPFPFIPNTGLCLALDLCRAADDRQLRGLIMLPLNIRRFVRLPGGAMRFMTVEKLLPLFLDRLFPGFEVTGQGVFRVLRDSELEIDEEAEDLVRTFESALKRRRRGTVIRLSLDAAMPELAQPADGLQPPKDLFGECPKAC